MKKFFAIILLVLVIFTFGCGAPSEVDKSTTTPDSNDDIICNISGVAVYGDFDREQIGEISIGLNIGHYSQFSRYFGEEYNKIAIVKCLVTIIDRPGDSMGLEVERTPYETVHKIGDFLDESYDFDKVKKKIDFLTFDTFGSDLNDGTYRIEYIMGIYDDSDVINYNEPASKCGGAGLWVYFKKTGNSYKLYTPEEWVKRVNK